MARHVTYWMVHIIVWAAFWRSLGPWVSFGRQVLNMTMWTPLFIFFGYPLVYLAVPRLMLRGKVLQFFMVTISWGLAGLWIDEAYRSYFFIPLQEKMGLQNILPRGPIATCYLCMVISAATPMIIKFYQLLSGKKQEVMHAFEEKAVAELQLLRAQVHPHFLFNTLNNIYSFSMLGHPRTPELIRKLSSLMHYMMYECSAELVPLDREVEIIRNYIDLERERYGEGLHIHVSENGDLKTVMITPLLLMPFLENAFKHGLSEQIDQPRLDLHLAVEDGVFTFRLVNSKNDVSLKREHGIGIQNVRKRLELVYPERHSLEIEDRTGSFTVRLMIRFGQARIMFRKEAEITERWEKAYLNFNSL